MCCNQGIRSQYMKVTTYYLLSSSFFVAFALLTALRADGVIAVSQFVCFLPLCLLNLGLLGWFVKLIRDEQGENEEKWVVYFFVTGLCIWNVLFWFIGLLSTSYAVRFIPFYVWLVWLAAFGIAFMAQSRREDQLKGAVLACCGLGCIFILLLIQCIFMVLKLDGAVDWSWKVVLVPVWLMNICFLLVLFAMTCFTVSDVVRNNNPPEAMAFTICSDLMLTPLMITEILLCIREDSGGRVAASLTVAPLVVGWIIILCIRIGGCTLRCREVLTDARQAYRARLESRKQSIVEREARKVPLGHATSLPWAARGGGLVPGVSRHGARSPPGGSTEHGTVAFYTSGELTDHAATKEEAFEPDDGDYLDGATQGEPLDGRDENKGPAANLSPATTGGTIDIDDELHAAYAIVEFDETIELCRNAPGESALRSALERLLLLVREHAVLQSDRHRKAIVDMGTRKQRNRPTIWTTSVARIYGRILRELSALHKLLRTISGRFGVLLDNFEARLASRRTAEPGGGDDGGARGGGVLTSIT